MRRIIGLCAALAFMAAPALVSQVRADAPFAPPTPLIDAGNVKPGPKVAAHTFTLNGVTGTLEKTTFDQVQKRFGGEVEHQGDAGGSLSWLCYDLPAKHLRVWLESDELHNHLHQISGISIWTVESPANSPRCPVVTGKSSANVDGIAPGQNVATLTARLGVPGLSKDSWSVYAHEAPSGGYTESDRLVVNSENGRITHLQAWRTTAN